MNRPHGAIGAISCLSTCAALALTNCGGKRTPITLDPSFSELQIEEVALLPIVDRRVDKAVEIDFEAKIRSRAKGILEGKGYVVALPTSFGNVQDLDSAEIARMQEEDLFSLGPEQNNFIAVLYIEDLVRKHSLFKFQSKMEASAVLLDKAKRTVIWKDKGIASEGEGGILGAAIEAAVFSDDAIRSALRSLFSTLPERRSGAQ